MDQFVNALIMQGMMRSMRIQQALQDMMPPASMYRLGTDELWNLITQKGPKPKRWTIAATLPDELIKRLIEAQFPIMAQNPPPMEEEVEQEYFRHYISWWVPTKEAIDAITKHVLEIGSGHALGARLLRDVGLNVLASDIQPQKDTFTAVKKMDGVEAVRKYPQCQTIMLAWPPQPGHQGAGVDARALQNFQGKQVIYIGEPSDCATGTLEFQQLLSQKWMLVLRMPLPRWPNIGDSLYIYRRR